LACFAELLQAALLFRAPEKHRDYSERSEGVSSARTQSKHPPSQLVILASLFAIIGAFPWMAAKIAPPRYPDQSQEFLSQKLVALSNTPTLDAITAFVSQPGSFHQIGRVSYPRFFGKDDGLASTNPWAAYAIRDYPRIGFLLLNQGSVSVVFPTKRISDFPHAADAIVLGCKREDYVEARLIAFPELDAVYFSEPFTETCSP
jgi:hypothetical protein